MRHADEALRAVEGVAAGGNRTSVKDAGQPQVYRFDGTETVAKDAAGMVALTSKRQRGDFTNIITDAYAAAGDMLTVERQLSVLAQPSGNLVTLWILSITGRPSSIAGGIRVFGGISHPDHRELQRRGEHSVAQRPQAGDDAQVDAARDEFGNRIVDPVDRHRRDRYAAHVIAGALIETFERLGRKRVAEQAA
jgi:hypothetical protein